MVVALTLETYQRIRIDSYIDLGLSAMPEDQPDADPIDICIRVQVWPSSPIHSIAARISQLVLVELSRLTRTNHRREIRSYSEVHVGPLRIDDRGGCVEVRCYFELR